VVATTKIKICGLSRAEDARYANICRPDYVGFIFAPSRRRIGCERARELRKALNPEITCVGVFVNENVQKVALLCKAGTIDMVQLHGDEDEEYIRTLRDMVNAPIIKTVHVGEELILPDATPNYFLFDTLTADVRGGSGKTFRWDAVKGYRGDYFLAGGLNNSNVEAAIQMLNPFCVDVSTGVETDGRKDVGKMSELVRKVRSMK
jgi:phosphoribosylanthranilate isomerase